MWNTMAWIFRCGVRMRTKQTHKWRVAPSHSPLYNRTTVENCLWQCFSFLLLFLLGKENINIFFLVLRRLPRSRSITYSCNSNKMISSFVRVPVWAVCTYVFVYGSIRIRTTTSTVMKTRMKRYVSHRPICRVELNKKQMTLHTKIRLFRASNRKWLDWIRYSDWRNGKNPRNK